mgnify:CR=1 FL=1
MGQNLIINYNRGKCIGAIKCIDEAAEYFSFDGEKAILKNSNEEEGISTLNVDVDSEQLSKIKLAAELCPVNAIRLSNQEGQTIVSDEVKSEQELRSIKAEYDDLKEFVMDDKGYFLIRVNQESEEIEVAFCPELNKITVKITGKKPIEIYQTIIKEGLISRMDHAAYLGRELQKAFIALQKKIPYVQDDELEI